ncbi:hypothetical protein F4806DRAFT_475778 [Annulohypoxylon nitens]|nr:hypothetical protein F4806DRAFT_475778 [Annulohypoxylon nitens]
MSKFLLIFKWILFCCAVANGASNIDTSSLKKLLSSNSYIGDSTTAPRWSDYMDPQPGTVVHPALEKDVQITVNWAIENEVPFLVQNGGNGWATTFTIGNSGIAIDLDLLRDVVFSDDKNFVTVGGGALVSNVTTAGAQNGALVATGTCDCVGFLGAVLGGGIGYLTGEYGLGVDNIVSMNVVLADGSAKVVTPKSSPDLFWALRGAGPNFGIVTSAVVKVYPVDNNNPSTAWAGALIYTPTQLDSVLGAIANLTMESHMSLAMTWALSNTSQPSIVVSVFYHGTEDAGRTAFASLFSIGPVSDGTAVTSYETWNVGTTTACIKGGRKPTWAVGMSRLDPTSWHAVYDVWAELAGQPGFEHSSVLVNINAMEKARELPAFSSAFPFRQTVNLFASITASYTDPSLDATALSYGQKSREIWQGGDGLAQHSTYINNAFGDESLETVYGVSLCKLKELKGKYDPQGQFNQWFPIPSN